MTTDIYGEVSTLEDLREINGKIREEMADAKQQPELTELKKRSDYLCTLTHSPSWQKRFGDKIERYTEVAREENRRTTKTANTIAERKGFEVEYHPWGSGD
jgi:hypothetical protein